MNKTPWYHNFWIQLTISIFFGLIVAFFLFKNDKLSAFGIGMATSGQILSYLKSQFQKRQSNNALIEVLKRFAADKIGMTKVQLKNHNDTSIVHCLTTLETIVTYIRNCCHKEQTIKFRTTKGLIADTKTTFDRAILDPGIEKPYADAMAAISNLESFLNDLE